MAAWAFGADPDHLSLQVPVDVAGIYDEQGEELPGALCGDNVRIRLRGVSDEDVSPGFVLTSAARPIKVVTQFRCDLAVLDAKNIISAGYSCVMHLHTLTEEVVLTVSLLDVVARWTKEAHAGPRPATAPLLRQDDEAQVKEGAPICQEGHACCRDAGDGAADQCGEV